MLGSKSKAKRIHMQMTAHERHLVKSLTADEEKAHSSLTEIPIIQTPLEIIKGRHIHEDKWMRRCQGLKKRPLSFYSPQNQQLLGSSALHIRDLRALMPHFSTCRTCWLKRCGYGGAVLSCW